MKVLIINVVCGIRSTGRICTDMAVELEKQGHEVKIAYGREDVPECYQKYAVRIGNGFDVRKHVLKSRFFDQSGFGSKFSTKRFIRWAEEYNPDLLWLNNLHGYYINVEELFLWIKKRTRMKTVWTLHDCWAFTGHCSYFTYAKCNKWIDSQNDNYIGCNNCSQISQYPKSYIDNSKNNYLRKKRAFTGVNGLEIVTPSIWLKEMVSNSFLSCYPVRVINNRINEELFKRTESDFKERHGIDGKRIILGVASVWEQRKGLEDYIKLSQIFDAENDYSDYQIVLLGLSIKQIKELKKKKINILALPVTKNTEELAKIYSAADVFLNLTKEDNYPTVNLEARACGLRVITYNTGGSPESAGDDAIVVENGNFEEIINGLKSVFEKKDKKLDNRSIMITNKDGFITEYLSVFMK